MTTNCRPGQRSQLHRAASALRDREHVVAVDVLSPAQDPSDEWTLEVTVGGGEGTPPTLLATLARYDCWVRDVSPRGSAFRVLAVAGPH